MPRSRLLKNLTTIAILAVVYFFAGKLGLRLAFANPSATAVWPSTGIALAAFLLIGYWVWPGILLAAFLTNLATAGSLVTSISSPLETPWKGCSAPTWSTDSRVGVGFSTVPRIHSSSHFWPP